jgi:hypothetical protein
MRRKKKTTEPMESRGRVFAHLLDDSAFIDKIISSANGRLADSLDDELLNFQNRGIARPRAQRQGLYSRRVDGVWNMTDNPVMLLYGKTKQFENVPDNRFTMRSESVPVTAAQVLRFVKGMIPGSPEISVSSLELTFDLTSTSISHLWRSVIHRASTDQIMGYSGSRTIYIGSPSSKWQARIYDKTNSVVRVEIVLRRPFLSEVGVKHPEDVLLLSRLKIWELLSVRRFSKSGAMNATKNWRERVYRDLIVQWPMRKQRLQDLVKFLRANGIDVAQVLPKAQLQNTLEKMQRRLVW